MMVCHEYTLIYMFLVTFTLSIIKICDLYTECYCFSGGDQRVCMAGPDSPQLLILNPEEKNQGQNGETNSAWTDLFA